ncbi:MAG: 6-phosphogluconolactonase [bacterium]|nr:6-phosphogluconolactonase [bacterium]
MAVDVRVYPSTLALAHAVCDQIVDIADRAITTRGRFTMALCGGSTPKPIYEMLASRDYAEAFNWTYAHVFWGDERCVPPTHPDSNYRMARELLLNRVKVPLSNLHRMEGENNPVKASEAYEADLRDFFTKRMGIPKARFDLVLLGMGGDGHTASLFPGLSAVTETEKWVMAQYVEKLDSWRLTLTPAAINAASHVFFLVTGAEKNATLRRVLTEPADPPALPAQAIQPVSGKLRWYLDEPAGRGLTS